MKKNGKWHVIMHLSALPGNSINDFIAPEQSSMHHLSMTQFNSSPSKVEVL